MSDLKTQPDDTDPSAFVAALGPNRQQEAQDLIAMMSRLTGAPPKIWSGSMVGFDAYDYRYASGRSGRWFLTGFRPAKARLSIYIMNGFDRYTDALARLGPHRHAKSCLYVTSLARIDMGVLEEIVFDSVSRMRLRYPGPA